MKTALIIVDLQYDFLSGGALAVPKANEIIPEINSCIDRYDYVIATMDWHPKGHISFASSHPGMSVGECLTLEDGTEQIMWPEHCIAESHGASLSSELKQESIDCRVKKGVNAGIDSYSGFFDNKHKQKTDLDAVLAREKIRTIDICGLATDYCVYYTVLDALSLGYTTRLLRNKCRAVNLHPDDEKKAVQEMLSKGTQLI